MGHVILNDEQEIMYKNGSTSINLQCPHQYCMPSQWFDSGLPVMTSGEEGEVRHSSLDVAASEGDEVDTNEK